MKKPSSLQELDVVFNYFIPFGNYLAMTFFGKIWIRHKHKAKWNADELKGNNKKTKNHEMVHVKQAILKKNSWFLFYLAYIWQYIKNAPIINGLDMPYKMVAFELEAYGNEYDYQYNEKYKNGTTNWKLYDKLTLKEKKKFYKNYKEQKISYNSFIKNNINPYLGIKN